MKILLTGVSGQLGRALLPGLNALGEVYAPDRQQLDLSRPEQLRSVLRELRPDLIVNPAAYTAVDQAESEAALAHAINAEAPAVMAEEARALGAALIHYSTDYVFDGSKTDAGGNWLAYDETDATGPLNVYGASKLAGEQAIRASGCAHLILRTSWVYSPQGKNFLLTMLRLAAEREELRVVDDQWGVPNSAGWLAQASCEILQQSLTSPSGPAWWQEYGGLYHLSATGKTSWCGFARSILQHAHALDLLSKAPPPVVGIPSGAYITAARRPQNSLLNTQHFQQRLHISVPDWEQNLHLCLQTMKMSTSPQDSAN